MLMIPPMETVLEWSTAFFRGNPTSPLIQRQVSSLSATMEDLNFGFQFMWAVLVNKMFSADMAKSQWSNFAHNFVFAIDCF